MKKVNKDDFETFLTRCEKSKDSTVRQLLDILRDKDRKIWLLEKELEYLRQLYPL